MLASDMTWDEHQKWERNWHGNCVNEFYEEQKQLEYAPKMGLFVRWDSQGPHIDCHGETICDVGGGPVSLLLKTLNAGRKMVIDPGDYPGWIRARYTAAGIDYQKQKAEELDTTLAFDEVWSYNLLQHTENPEEIVRRMRKIAKIIRVYDWLEVGVAPGHPQNLHEVDMNRWFGGEGKVEKGRVGYSYSGIFKGDRYGT